MSKRPWVAAVPAAVLSLALAGCSMFATTTAMPPLVDGAPVPLVKYDGSYQGRARLVSMPGTGCPASGYGVIAIGDHTLNFAYQPNVVFVAPVAEDGTIHDVAGPASLDGQITDGLLAMTIKTPDCETRYSARLIWNRS